MLNFIDQAPYLCTNDFSELRCSVLAISWCFQCWEKHPLVGGWTNPFWLVVSTHLKNISQNGSFPQVGVEIKNIWNHHPAFGVLWVMDLFIIPYGWGLFQQKNVEIKPPPTSPNFFTELIKNQFQRSSFSATATVGIQAKKWKTKKIQQIRRRQVWLQQDFQSFEKKR